MKEHSFVKYSTLIWHKMSLASYFAVFNGTIQRPILCFDNRYSSPEKAEKTKLKQCFIFFHSFVLLSPFCIYSSPRRTCLMSNIHELATSFTSHFLIQSLCLSLSHPLSLSEEWGHLTPMKSLSEG